MEFIPSIKRVFVEKKALDYPATKVFLAVFGDRNPVLINCYKNILNRKHQSVDFQKKHLKAAVLGVKTGRFTYKQVRCSTLPGYEARYVSPVIGCLQECSYCFVNKKYGCGHIIIFVNFEDFIRSTIEALQQEGRKDKPWISFGYDSELLQFPGFYPMIRTLLKESSRVAKQSAGHRGGRGGGILELITKTASRDAFFGIPPPANTIISFSISPTEVWENHEHGTAPPSERLETAALLMGKGWRVALRIDPVLPVKNCASVYCGMIESLGSRIDLGRIEFLETGKLRFPGPTAEIEWLRLSEINEKSYDEAVEEIRSLVSKSVKVPVINC